MTMIRAWTIRLGRQGGCGNAHHPICRSVPHCVHRSRSERFATHGRRGLGATRPPALCSRSRLRACTPVGKAAVVFSMRGILAFMIVAASLAIFTFTDKFTFDQLLVVMSPVVTLY